MLVALLLALTATFVGGQQTSSPANVNPEPASDVSQQAAAVKPQGQMAGVVDPCSLLTSGEIAAVQGEPVRETRRSEQTSSGLRLLQCFYGTPSVVKSVSVTVALRKSSGAREYWQARFHNAAQHKSKPVDGTAQQSGEAQSLKRQPPLKVSGIGEEAFWMGSRFAGALYILLGDRFLRVSVGGGKEEEKLRKSKQLAQHALHRLEIGQAKVR